VAADCELDARAVWRRLGRAGLIRELYAPTRPGSYEPDPVRLDALLTELDARLPPGVVLSICVQLAAALPLVAQAAGDSTVACAVVDAALDGEAALALAVTDAGAAGSDLLTATTRVCVADDLVVVDGGKDWITNAVQCDYALVLCRHRSARHFTSFRWVLTPAGAPGVSAHPTTGSLFAGAGVGHLRFCDVTLDRRHLIGPPGRALAAFTRQVAVERLAGALWARALCRRVLADTRRWLASRAINGGWLWDNAAVRERFARALVDYRRIEALCVVHRTGIGAVGVGGGMLLKAAVADGVDRVLRACADLRGADAFRDGGEAVLRAEMAMFGVAGGATGTMLAGVAEHADELLGTVR